MNNVYKKIITCLFLWGLLIAPLQNFAAAAGPFSDNRERGLDSDNKGLDEVTPEALPEFITLKFKGSDQSVQVPRGALMRSQLGKNAFSDNAEETELVLDQNLVAGFTLKELAELLQVSEKAKIESSAWQQYLEKKDDLYLYRLLLLERYLHIPDLYEALTTEIASKIDMSAKSESWVYAWSSYFFPGPKSPLEDKKNIKDIFTKIKFAPIDEFKSLRGFVDSVAWSPDGSQIVFFGSTIHSWDTRTKELKEHNWSMTPIAGSARWSSLGEIAYIADSAFDAGNKDIEIMNLVSSKKNPNSLSLGYVAHIPMTNNNRTIAWSSDGTKIAATGGDIIYVWENRRGPSKELNPTSSNLNSIAWSPDGSRIVSGSEDGTVGIWDVATGENTRTLNGHTNEVNSVAWSPDGSQIVSGSWDNTVRIWDAATGENTRTLNGHTDRVNSVAWSPDGSQIVSGSDDTTVHIWNAATGENIQTLRAHTRKVSSVAWSPDGKQIVSGSWDGTVRIWGKPLPASEKEILTWIEKQRVLVLKEMGKKN